MNPAPFLGFYARQASNHLLVEMGYAAITHAEFKRWVSLWLRMSCFLFGGIQKLTIGQQQNPPIHFDAH